MPAGRPLKFQNVKEFEKSVEEYFAKAGDKPTITGLALHLDCDLDTIKNYTERDEFFGPLKKAYLRVQQGYENRMHEGACTGAIFALKNFGWKDKQEVENSGETSMTIKWAE